MVSSILAGAWLFGFLLVLSRLKAQWPDDDNRYRVQQLLGDFFSVAVSAWRDLIRGAAWVVHAASEPVCLCSHFCLASSFVLFWCEVRTAACPFVPDIECIWFGQLEMASYHVSSDCLEAAGLVTARIVAD